MSIETIVFLYIYVCVCMLAFNVAYVVYGKYSDKMLVKRIYKFTHMIDEQLFRKRNNFPMSDKIQNRIYRRAQNLQQLIAFDAALTELQKKHGKAVDQYIGGSHVLFMMLAIAY